MPQECLNFCMNSLVCIFFSSLGGNSNEQTHNLAFPQIYNRVAGGGWGQAASPCWVKPQYLLQLCPQHTLQPLFPSPLHNQWSDKNSFPSITVYSLENATRLNFHDKDSEKRDSRDTVAFDDLLTLTPHATGKGAFRFSDVCTEPSSNMAWYS